MINIVDDFLELNVYQEVYDNLFHNQFQEIEVGDKKFWVQYSNKEFDDYIVEKLSAIDGVQRECLLGFFRVATEEFDTDWRIHADSKVADIRPERALVLYLSTSTKEGLHGTAFWRHKKLGYNIPDDISNEEFDRMLRDEANDLDNWDLHTVIGYRPNRALMYPSTYFHSKYPNTGWKEGRMVYVMFYR
jgi:hypothetical protein